MNVTHNISKVRSDQKKWVWKAVFVALTDREFLLYDIAPWSKEEWATPFENHPIIATRFVTNSATFVNLHKKLIWLVYHLLSSI